MADQLLHGRAHALAGARHRPPRGPAASRRGARPRGRSSTESSRSRRSTPPDRPLLLDDGDALAELGRLNRGPLAGRAAADADEIVVVAVSHVSPFRLARLSTLYGNDGIGSRGR